MAKVNRVIDEAEPNPLAAARCAWPAVWHGGMDGGSGEAHGSGVEPAGSRADEDDGTMTSGPFFGPDGRPLFVDRMGSVAIPLRLHSVFTRHALVWRWPIAENAVRHGRKNVCDASAILSPQFL